MGSLTIDDDDLTGLEDFAYEMSGFRRYGTVRKSEPTPVGRKVRRGLGSLIQGVGDLGAYKDEIRGDLKGQDFGDFWVDTKTGKPYGHGSTRKGGRLEYGDYDIGTGGSVTVQNPSYPSTWQVDRRRPDNTIEGQSTVSVAAGEAKTFSNTLAQGTGYVVYVTLIGVGAPVAKPVETVMYQTIATYKDKQFGAKVTKTPSKSEALDAYAAALKVPAYDSVVMYEGQKVYKQEKVTATYAKLPDGTLISIGASIYLLEGGKKRPIPSMEVFNALGYKMEKVVKVGGDEGNQYPVGEPMAAPPPPPPEKPPIAPTPPAEEPKPAVEEYAAPSEGGALDQLKSLMTAEAIPGVPNYIPTILVVGGAVAAVIFAVTRK